MSRNEFPKGARVQINRRHRGCRGSTGRVSRKAPVKCQGHPYWAVRLTGGRGRGMTMRFLASEMGKV